MRDNNDFDESKLDAGEIKLSSKGPFLTWLDNFWYYHKWKVIIILFFVAVFTVGILQMVGKEEEDGSVVVAAPIYFYSEHISGLDTVLTGLMPDGAKNLNVYTYSIYSEAELDAWNKAAREEETDAYGNDIGYIQNSVNVDRNKEYRDYLQTGECSILFISQHLYNSLKENDRLRPISDVFGNEKANGVLSDGYGIRLGDTYLYEFFEEIQVLPADTVICLMRPYIWGASSDSAKYEKTVEFFKNIVNFGK